jgi:hypothetical protein
MIHIPSLIILNYLDEIADFKISFIFNKLIFITCNKNTFLFSFVRKTLSKI